MYIPIYLVIYYIFWRALTGAICGTLVRAFSYYNKQTNKGVRQHLCTKTKKILDAPGRTDKSAQNSGLMRGTGTGDK